MHEAWLDGGGVVVFDGVAVDAFLRGNTTRMHLSHIREISLKEGRKGAVEVTVSAAPYGGLGGFKIAEGQRPAFEALFAAINEARRARYGWDPLPT